MNYNISLLKTIINPLNQAFDGLIEDMENVVASNIKTKEIRVENIVNIIGSLQMIGRMSLVYITKDVRYAVEQLQKSELMHWDHIRVSEVSNAIKKLVSEVQSQVKILARGEKKIAVSLWSDWNRLQETMKRESPDVNFLFDPDPEFSIDQFSALDVETLTESSRPHLQRLEDTLNKLQLLNKNSGKEDWQNLLVKLESVFDWAYALKHRMGYQGYWLACRARIAYELLNLGNNSETENDQLIQSFKSSQVELRKFISDARKPRVESIQQMMLPLLKEWPISWDAMYSSLAEIKEIFSLEEFWNLSKKAVDQNNSSGGVIIDIEDLNNSIQNLKKNWANLAAAEETDPRPFLRSLMTFLPKYERYENPGLKSLLESLKIVAHRFVSNPKKTIDSEFSQEVAICLLVIEETIIKNGSWSKELEKQADLIRRRLQLATNEVYDQLAVTPNVVWGEEKTRQQTQDAISKVIKEILIDLDFIEKTFDDYFRFDVEEARANFEDVKQKSLTCLSILSALGQHNAVILMQEINNNVFLLNRPNPNNFKNEYGMLSIAITGLTSFLSAFEKGDQDAIRLLEPALKHIGAAQKVDKQLNEFDIAENIKEKIQINETSNIDQLVEEDTVQDNVENVVEEVTNSNIEEELDEAEEEQEEEEIQEFLSQDEMDIAQQKSQKYFDQSIPWVDRVVDEELAEAFFEEADLVLDEIKSLRNDLKSKFDPEFLMDLRRQYHTLKGSGRTTQFWGCGEMARRLEERVNLAISKREGYSTELDNIVDFSINIFELILSELNETKQFTFDTDLINGIKDSIFANGVKGAKQEVKEEIVDDKEITMADFNFSVNDEPKVEEIKKSVSSSGFNPINEIEMPEDEDEEEDSSAFSFGFNLTEELATEKEEDEKTLDGNELESEDSDLTQEEEDEQLDAILTDLETHTENLREFLDNSTLDLGSLNWSAHTISSLASMLDQKRYQVFAKNVERIASQYIDLELDENLDVKSESFLRIVANLLLNKAIQLMEEPSDLLLWTESEETLEDRVSTFDANSFINQNKNQQNTSSLETEEIEDNELEEIDVNSSNNELEEDSTLLNNSSEDEESEMEDEINSVIGNFSSTEEEDDDDLDEVEVNSSNNELEEDSTLLNNSSEDEESEIEDEINSVIGNFSSTEEEEDDDDDNLDEVEVNSSNNELEENHTLLNNSSEDEETEELIDRNNYVQNDSEVFKEDEREEIRAEIEQAISSFKNDQNNHNVRIYIPTKENEDVVNSSSNEVVKETENNSSIESVNVPIFMKLEDPSEIYDLENNNISKEEQENQIIFEIQNKMAEIARHTNEMHQLWEKLSKLRKS